MKTGKIKELKHEWIRSFFFAQQDTEEKKVIIDGIPCAVIKDHADRAYSLRHSFGDIYKAIGKSYYND